MDKSLIKIPLKKSISELLTILAGIVPLFGTGFLLFFDDKYQGNYLANIVGIISILFWGGGAIYVLYYHFKKQNGLEISSEGIFNNSIKNFKSEIVPWGKIKDINISKKSKINRIIIQLENEEEYISSFSKKRIQKVLRKNQEEYGSPIIIDSDRLDLNMVSLLEILKNGKKKNLK